MAVTKIPKKTITLIEPKKSFIVDKAQHRQKRVAAYCRVSTDSEEQLTSYTNQMKVYTEMIASNKEWEFAGLYADEGISGTRADKRPQFQKMIDDCHKGKIDMIITKSVSRFARNTVDCLDYVRLLKEIGVGIYFEEQNIDTLKSDSELYLVIYAGFAQSESESISKNITWTHRKNFEEADFEIDFAKRLNSIGCRNEIYNVGCMYWNYEPVTLDEIIERGRTIRPTYGERSAEYMTQFPWEKNQTVNSENEIRWNMFYHNCNSRSIETFNVFEHGSFREYVKQAAKKYQSKEDFAKQLRSEVMYYFWSKCEWEVLVTPWVSPRESEKKKVDVCWQIMNNWDVFVDYTWANRKKL